MKNQIKKTTIARSKNIEIRTQWNKLVVDWEAQLSEIIEQAKSEKLFESLYVSRSDDRRQIQLFSGVHPVDSKWKYDEHGRRNGIEVSSEHGAAIVISQSTLGSIAIMLYPYESDELKRSEKMIFWEILEHPRKLTKSKLNKAIADWFRYMRVSSAVMNESAYDRAKINYLIFMNRRYTTGSGVVKFAISNWFVSTVGFLSSIAGIYSAFQ